MSNSEATSTKCSKTTTKSEDEGSGEGEPAAGKSTMRKCKGAVVARRGKEQGAWPT